MTENNDTLIFFMPTPTLISSININELDKMKSGNNDEWNYLQIADNENLYFRGSFNDFHIYIIVTHSKFSIIPDSIEKLENGFNAAILLLDENKKIHVNFRIPIDLKDKNWSDIQIKASSFGNNQIYDGFSFSDKSLGFNVFCDLNFIAEYSTNMNEKIRLEIQYIGIAEKEHKFKISRREVADRLGTNGHSKLQQILANLQRQPNKMCSICLYKFKEDDLSKVIDFSTSIKAMEASLISYFQTDKYNVQRLKFPRKENLKTPNSLENILISKNIQNILTFVVPPAYCSIYSTKSNQSNINERKRNCLRIQFQIFDYVEYVIHIDMKKITNA